MYPKDKSNRIRTAFRWPEPISFVFSIEDARDIEAPNILRSVVERNGGELQEDFTEIYNVSEARSVDDTGQQDIPPPIYRAEFPQRTIDGITSTFEQVDQDLRKELREQPDEPPIILRQLNWHTGGTPCDPGNGSGGGPGARPAPFKVSTGSAIATTPLADKFAGKAQRDSGKVRLVIFDAWNRDTKETQKLSNTGNGWGTLLYSLNTFPNEEKFNTDLDTYAANRENDPFPIPDHGLFVAAAAAQVAGWEHFALHPSLLHRISDNKHRDELEKLNGGVQVESVRVLGEYGVGDTFQLVWHLERLANSIQPDEKVIVNLSLVINTPPERFALRRLFGANAPTSADALHVALHSAIRKLHKAGALIIAAAGNSSAGDAVRHRALYPAAFDEVLAVTAATPDGTKEAYYANRVFSKGVAVFGGTVKKDVNNGKIIVDEKFPLDGPFTDSKVPVFGDDPDNESGQVLWAGTSFATPRVAGLAARLWLADPALSNKTLADKIRGCAESTLQCGTPYINL
jgi:hypothetical protein